MIRLERENDHYIVYQDNRRMGTVERYDNPCHKNNCYLKLEMNRVDTGLSAELFRKLREAAGRPLQVMVSSDNTDLTDFLTAGGFVCKRKCYEVEASAADYIGSRLYAPLLRSRIGQPDYDSCCRRMFDYYVEAHKAINPWTADYEAFVRSMPADVVYEKADGRITNLAFIEGNEIAYVCGSDEQGFSAVLSGLIPSLFEKQKTICFESDDCDWAAMRLKAMFVTRDQTSMDTYVYD